MDADYKGHHIEAYAWLVSVIVTVCSWLWNQKDFAASIYDRSYRVYRKRKKY
jgi:hypothetical protein